MKAVSRRSPNHSVPAKPSFAHQRAYWTAIWLASLTCSSAALAQTNAPPVVATNAPASGGSSTNVVKLQETTVVGKLDTARNQIMPDLGATVTTLSQEQILSGSQGDNAPVNQLILRAPGVAQDSAANGDLHVRGEHANLQYRINDVLLPREEHHRVRAGSSIRVLSTNLKFITGSLPAHYRFSYGGHVVDITTRSRRTF